MRRIAIMLLAGGTLWSNPVFAADALKFAPAPAWVRPQPLPAAAPSQAPVALLLKDEQTRLERGKITAFTEGALKIQNEQGLSAGNLAIIWQPATDTVTINKLQIRRGDKVIDVLAAGQTFTVLRRETNLDAATLDGTLTATIQPEGLQVGDVIDFATTVERSDPVMKGHVEALFGVWGGLPIQAAHAALSWPAGLNVQVHQTPSLPVARRSSEKGMNVLELSGQNVQPLIAPKGSPQRFQVGRLAEATDFSSWADMANLFTPLFRDASAIPATGPLHDEVERIRAASASPKVRAEMALALVQDRVRYVALLMGQGGYVPAPAETTWSRRFGDCKAKTALLLGVLHSLGIQAEPVLAQVKLGDMIADRLPTVQLFNHVLVRAHIGEKDYWLDGTRTGDSDLDKIEIPDFGWGLPLVANAKLVHMVPGPLAAPNLERHISIDASSGIYTPAQVTIEQVYRGDSAVELNTLYSALTAEQRDEQLHDAAKTFFDSFVAGSSSVQFDKAKRELHVSIKGAAKLGWKDHWFDIPTSSIGFDPDFDRPAGPLHDVPVAVAHPLFVKDSATIRLPPGLAARQEVSKPVHDTLAGVEYARSEAVSGDTVTIESSERSIAPEVAYADALAAEARLRKLSKDDIYLNSAVYSPTSADLAAVGGQSLASADDYVERGNLFLNGNKYDEAIADYTAALKVDPANEPALVGRGMSHVLKNEFALAEADLTAAAAKNQQDSLIGRARGLMAERKGDCAKAVAFYGQSIAIEPDSRFTLERRARCEVALSNYVEALTDATAALKIDPDAEVLHELRAGILLNLGNRDAAIGEAKLVQSRNPESRSALLAVAGIYRNLGLDQEAVAVFDHALAAKKDASLLLLRAQFRPSTDIAARIADLDEGLKLEPANEQLLEGKAYLLAQSGNYASAISYYDRAALTDHSPELAANRAVALFKAGKTADAAKEFAAARTSAHSPVELNNLCWIKATAGVQLDLALAECRQSLKLLPQSGPTLDSLGMVLLKLGKLDEALEAYDKAVALNTGAASLMGRAIVHARKGDHAHADADAAAARKLYPKIDSIFVDYGLKL